MKAKILKTIAGFAIAGVFLYFLIHNIDLMHIWHDMKNVNPTWFMLAFSVFILAIITRAERWRQILLPINPSIPTFSSWGIFCLGLFLNVALPFRLGDILRSTFATIILKTPVAILTTSVIIEKICDITFIFLLGGFALLYMPRSSQIEDLHIGGFLLLLIGLASIAFLLFAHWLRKPTLFISNKIFCKFPVFEKKLNGVLGLLFDSFKSISSPIVMLRILFWSAISWIFEWMAFAFLAFGVANLAKPSASLLTMPIATLSTAIPGAPGGIGPFDFFAVETMQLLGNAQEPSLAYAFLIHIIILTSPIITLPVALIPIIYNFIIMRNSK